LNSTATAISRFMRPSFSLQTPYFTNTHAGWSSGNAINPMIAVAATSTGLLTFHRNSTIKLERATSAVSQSPIAMRPSRTHARRWGSSGTG